jgi:predicted MFS family arabinose efflux permease
MTVVEQIGLGIATVVGGLLLGWILHRYRAGAPKVWGWLTLGVLSVIMILIFVVLAFSGSLTIMLWALLFLAWYVSLGLQSVSEIRTELRRWLGGH